MSPAGVGARRRASLTKFSGIVSRTFQPTTLRESAVQPDGQIRPAPAPAGQARDVAHPHPVRVRGANWPSKRLGAARTAGSKSVVRGTSERGCCAQTVGFEHATDAPAAHGVAVGLHFHPQPAGAVALAVLVKRSAYVHLPGRLDRRVGTC
jgi:hypothetical protein